MQSGKTKHTAALAACSNLLSIQDRELTKKVRSALEEEGITVIESPLLYKETVPSQIGLGKRKAEILNVFFKNPGVDMIFDLSGGDMANEVLPWLDYEAIGKSRAVFYGYSDLTTVLNAIYAKTGKQSVLYQLKQIAREESGEQLRTFQEYLQGGDRLFQPAWQVLQGKADPEKLIVNRTVIGGNIRCFLKLAGTEYFPDLKGKVLFLEALGGDIPQISTYMASLNQLHAFRQVSAVLMGTFTELERNQDELCAWEILKNYIPSDLPVAKTRDVGHSVLSKALRIG